MVSLLVVISDSLSDLVKKGEITARYYNPGELFDDVHILMTNNDKPDREAVQKTVGRARLHLHNLPLPSVISTFGWQPFMLKKWIASGIELAREIQPSLIRAYGNSVNGFLAAQIKQQQKIPLVTSLHINPDVDIRNNLSWRSNWLIFLMYKRMVWFENATLKNSDIVLPVYESIRGYAIDHGAKQVKVCYNVLNSVFLCKKQTYSLHTPPRIISVGRQFDQKNPDNLIRAVALIPDVELTLIGYGPYHKYLEQVAIECKIQDRVIFYKGIPNDQLCKILPDYDIFAVHNEYWGISKALIEALLTGLPVIHNKRKGEPVHEFNENFICLVENTVDGYHDALQSMLTDHTFREQIGRNGYSHAQALWSPEITEAEYVKVYQNLLSWKKSSS
ncbi:MAG: glycosyltransferase family 4 protein [Methanoregula sp.]|nr:glycosyltransferase family 4 protein [Methanoregula sp.]